MTDLLTNLNYHFKNKKLLSSALHHSSVKNCSVPFERLEFLGDRVLGIIIAEYIYRNFKEAEGSMAKMHSAFVCAEACRDIAIKLGIQKVIATSDKALMNNKTVLADATEALLGAIFIDSDYKTVKEIVLNLWSEIFQKYDEHIQEPKTRLQEICQREAGKVPAYELVSVSGPDHDPRFTISVQALGKTVKAVGHSKKEAETEAAKLMLMELAIK